MHKILMAAVLAAAALPGLASADDHYLRGGFGLAEPDSGEFDDNSHAMNLGFGWRFSRYFSVEGGYSDLGDYGNAFPGIGGPVDLGVTSLELGMAAKIPFGSSSWFGQVRAGAHRWESKRYNFEGEFKENGVDPYASVGIGHDITDLFSVSLNYERFRVGDEAIGDIDRVMLSFELR